MSVYREIDRLKRAAEFLPDPVRDLIAEQISGYYRQIYEANRTSPEQSMDEFFGQNPDMMKKIRSTPLSKVVPDIKKYTGKPFSIKGNIDTWRYSKAYQDTAGRLRNANIGQAQGILASSVLPGVLAMSPNLQPSANIIDETWNRLTSAWENIAAGVPNFTPGRGNFLSFALGQGGLSAVSQNAEEEEVSPYEGLSLDTEGSGLDEMLSATIGENIHLELKRNKAGRIVATRYTDQDHFDSWPANEDIGKSRMLSDDKFRLLVRQDQYYHRARMASQDAYAAEFAKHGIPGDLQGNSDAAEENRLRMSENASFFLQNAPGNIPLPYFNSRRRHPWMATPQQILEMAGHAEMSSETRHQLDWIDASYIKRNYKGVKELSPSQRFTLPSRQYSRYARALISQMKGGGTNLFDELSNEPYIEAIGAKADLNQDNEEFDWDYYHQPFISPEEYRRAVASNNGPDTMLGDERETVPYEPVYDIPMLEKNKKFRGRTRGSTMGIRTTWDAIVAGERTATTMWGEQAGRLMELNQGDIVGFKNDRGRIAYAMVTERAKLVDPQTDDDFARWSKLEGWSVGYSRELFGRKGPGYQIQYEYLQGGSQLLREKLEERLIGYRRIGEGTEDDLVDHYMQTSGKEPDADTELLDDIYGETANEITSQSLRRGALAADLLTYSPDEPGFVEYMAGKKAISGRGRISGYKAEASAAASKATQTMIKRVGGMGYGWAEKARGALQTKGALQAKVQLAKAAPADFSGARAAAEEIFGQANIRLATSAEQSGRPFAAKALGATGEIILGKPFFDDKTFSKYIEKGIVQTAEEARVFTLGHEIGHLHQQNNPAIISAIKKMIDAKTGQQKGAISKKIGETFSNAWAYRDVNTWHKEVFADLYASSRGGFKPGLMAQTVLTEEEIEEIMSMMTDSEFPMPDEPPDWSDEELERITGGYNDEELAAFHSYNEQLEDPAYKEEQDSIYAEAGKEYDKELADALAKKRAQITGKKSKSPKKAKSKKAPKRQLNFEKVWDASSDAYDDGSGYGGENQQGEKSWNARFGGGWFAIDYDPYAKSYSLQYDDSENIKSIATYDTLEQAKEAAEVYAENMLAPKKESADPVEEVFIGNQMNKGIPLEEAKAQARAVKSFVPTQEYVHRSLSMGARSAVLASTNSWTGEAIFRDGEGKPTYNRSGAKAMSLANQETGEITVPSRQLDAAVTVLQGSYEAAFDQGSLPDDPKAYLATIKQRINKSVNQWFNSYTDEIMNAFDDPEERQEALRIAQRMKKVIYDGGRTMVDNLAGALEAEGYDTTGWKDIDARKLRSEAQLQDLMQASPEIRRQIMNMGGVHSAMAGPTTVLADETGDQYLIGDAYGSRGGYRGKWGSQAGSFLYSAYLMKRMFAMTIQPGIQEAEYYSQKIDEPMAAIAGLDLSTSKEGVATRASLARDLWAQGAQEQFGGFSTASYAMASAFPGLSRAASGIGLGLGIMGGAGMLGMMAATMPGMGFLAGAGPVGMAVGGGIMAAAAGMEIRNLLNPDAEPVTFGSIAEETAAGMLHQRAYYRAQQSMQTEQPGLWSQIVNARQRALDYRRGGAPLESTRPSIYDQIGTVDVGDEFGQSLIGRIEPTEEEILAQMTPNERRAYEASKAVEDPVVQSLKAVAMDIKSITGEEYNEIQPGLRAMFVGLGGDAAYERQWKPLVQQRWSQGRLTSKETAQSVENIASQLGYGHDDWAPVVNQLLGMDESEIRAFERRAGQIGRFAGMFSGYYEDPRDANIFARRNDIVTQQQAMGIQSLMGAAMAFGGSPSDIVSYQLGARGRDVTPVRLDDYLAKLAAEYGPYRSQLAGTLSTQLQSMGVGQLEAASALGAFGIQNQPQLQSTLSWLGAAQTFGSQMDPLAIGAASMGQNIYQSGVMLGAAQRMATLGNVDLGTAQVALSSLGMTNRQAWMFDRMISGDLGAWSQNAREQGTYAGRFLNDYGAPIYMTSGREWARMVNAQAELGNPYATSENLEQILGTGDREALRAWLDGGSTGRSILNRERNWGFQQEGFALQRASIDLQWGHTQQQWGFQDQQRALSFASQMTDFAVSEQRMRMENRFAGRQEDLSWRRMNLGQSFAVRQEDLSWTRMDLSNQFAIQGEALQLRGMEMNQAFAERAEGLSWRRIELAEKYGGRTTAISRERMLLGHENQLWNLQFSYDTSLLQREFTEQNWGYEDQTRALQFGWTMEDLNENIRYASGRQRRQLIKQRERAAMMQSLEEGQIEQTRSQQEALWGREDERYKVQEEYIRKLIDLDKEQYQIGEDQRLEAIALDKEEWQLSKERREENYKLDKEQYELSVRRREEMFELDTRQFELSREQRIAMFELDKEQFELTKERRLEFYNLEREELQRKKNEFLANWKIEEEKIKAERAYLNEQHELSLKNLDLSRRQAEEAHNYAIEVEKISRLNEQIVGSFKTQIENDPTAILDALGQMAIRLNDVPKPTLDALNEVIRTIGRLDAYKLDQLVDALVTMLP